MKTFSWTLKDGSLRLFKDRQLDTIVGGWDSDTGRIFEIVGPSHDASGTPIQRRELDVRTGATKDEALEHFRTLSAEQLEAK